MTCPNCKTSNLPTEAIFCPNCGAKIVKDKDMSSAITQHSLFCVGHVAVVHSAIYNQGLSRTHRVMSPQTAAALDFMVSHPDLNLCIITMGLIDQYVEIGYHELGDGVLETIFTFCATAGDCQIASNVFSKYKLMGRSTPDYICVFDEDTNDYRKEQLLNSLFCAFGSRIPVVTASSRKGGEIMNNVLNGTIRDVLVLDTLGFDIWAECVDYRGQIERVVLFSRYTTIPTKDSWKIKGSGEKIMIYSGCMELPNTITLLQEYYDSHLKNLRNLQEKESNVWLSVDVDTNGFINVVVD